MSQTDLEKMLGEGLTDGNEGEEKPTGEGGESPETLLEGQEEGDGDEGGDNEGELEGEGEPEKSRKNTDEDRIEGLERTISQLTVELRSLKQKPEEKPKPVELNIELDDDMYEKAMASRDGFVKVLKNTAQTVQAQTLEAVMAKLPELIDSMVTNKVSLQSTIDTFWRANRDLIPHKKYVAHLYNEVSAQYPDLEPTEIIERKLAATVRKQLGLKGPAKIQPGKKPNVAPGAQGRQAPKKPLAGIASEIAAMEKI